MNESEEFPSQAEVERSFTAADWQQVKQWQREWEEAEEYLAAPCVSEGLAHLSSLRVYNPEEEERMAQQQSRAEARLAEFYRERAMQLAVGRKEAGRRGKSRP